MFLRGGILLLALALPAAAWGGQSEDDIVCTIKAKSSYRLAKATRPGMAVRITCDAPTKVFAAVDLLPGRAERNVNRKAHPGSDGFSARRAVGAGEPATFRVKLNGYASRAVRKASGSKIIFVLGIRQSDGNFHNNPGPGGSDRSKLVTG